MKKIFTVFCMTLLLFGFMVSVVTAGSQAPVVLGTAGNYVILSKAGISAVPTCTITGYMGVSPIARVGLTGWSETMDETNLFSTSSQVTGKLFAADYSVPTPANLTKAVSDMEAAYVSAAGRTNPDFTELGAGDISGMTLAPGLYKWSTAVLINGNVTLYGAPDDVWIFQIAKGITQANNTRIILTGGAQASNIFWQSAGAVAIGTTAYFQGIVLGATGITVNTGGTVNGKLLSQTAVTLKMSTITNVP